MLKLLFVITVLSLSSCSGGKRLTNINSTPVIYSEHEENYPLRENPERIINDTIENTHDNPTYFRQDNVKGAGSEVNVQDEDYDHEEYSVDSKDRHIKN